jgi:hypothetical protein
MLGIPERVRIGSVDYKVNLVDTPVFSSDGARCYGRIMWSEHFIEIDKSIQDYQGQEITFLHELIHGMIHEHNIDVGDDEAEEKLTERLAMALHQIIRDNKDVFR